jgi:hypothetical protein
MAECLGVVPHQPPYQSAAFVVQIQKHVLLTLAVLGRSELY